MKKLTDEQLEKQIKVANERLEKLQQAKDARLQARRNQLAKYLKDTYNVTTISELESLLHRPQTAQY